MFYLVTADLFDGTFLWKPVVINLSSSFRFTMKEKNMKGAHKITIDVSCRASNMKESF